ncbi:BACON domain-containing protein [Maribacter dokdonensis]|nr:BACON domain-containing protein [Maribacter dokdonensis]
MTKAKIEEYMFAYIDGSYSSSQLVPFNKIKRAPYINITRTGNEDQAAHSFTLALKVDGAFTVSRSSNWFSISPSSGSGDTTLTVTLTANTNGLSRLGILTVTSTPSGKTFSYEFDQDGIQTNPTSAVPLSVSQGARDVCELYPGTVTTYYVTQGKTFTNTSILYSDNAGTTNAPAGYYSNGEYHRYWNGSQFTGNMIECDNGGIG